MTWDELVATATVGTDRRPGQAPVEVLELAAAATAYRRAGALPVTGLPRPAPAPPETAPLAPAPAVRRLAGLLGSGAVDGEARFPLLSEWLRLAAARGVRVPPELLPGLLDAGRQRTGLRPLIADAGGARAGWLAAQRAEWGYLAGTVEDVADDPAVWSEGTPGQRAGYLRAARRRGPDEARELLVAEWAALPPEERAQLVEALGVGLGPADEEFLEAALDDRRAAVRSVAATLLGRLPGSGYVARMTERARACLRVADGQATVTAPETCDKAMRRDGIAAKPPSGIGERAWWLEEILARAPLSTWDPAMRDATIDDGWSRAVYRGLGRAAAAQQDPDWAAALVPKLGPRDSDVAHSLYATLDPADLAAGLEYALGSNPGRGPDLVRLLGLCPAPWPAGLSRAVLANLEFLARSRDQTYGLDAVCRVAAFGLSPAAVGPVVELAERLGEEGARTGTPDNYRLRQLFQLADTLRFRHDMTEEFA